MNIYRVAWITKDMMKLKYFAVFAFCFVVFAGDPTFADAITKRSLPTISSLACKKIKEAAGSFATERTVKTTRYFTPLFEPGSDGGLQQKDRYNCLEMEGACIVGNYLYNTGGRSVNRYDRREIKFIFGQGNGSNENYNTYNALFPCRTVAADQGFYPVGTVIYVPAAEDRVCPQNGKRVDGCFVVGDVGKAIKGRGRFDLFTGECSDYDDEKHFCRDRGDAAFDVPSGSTFHVVARNSAAAKAVRDEIDAFVGNGWK